MKFLALKDALDAVLPPPEKPAPKPLRPPEVPSIPFFNPDAKKQTVVGGDILRTPVNRTAAMVIAKAPWWAKPPPTPFSPTQPPPPAPVIKPKRKPQHSTPMSDSKQITNYHPAQTPGETVHGKANDVLNAEMATEAIKRTHDTIENLNKLVDGAKDARAALDIMCDYWKRDWIDFMEQGDQRLKDLRVFRMSFDTETKLLMSALRDVRQFFLDKQHDAEVARLKEFVDLCERLQKLKTSGFLDTVADTLLKIS